MTVSSSLQRVFGRGAYVNFAPIIVEARAGRFQSVRNEIEARGGDIRHDIPSFNMISSVVGNLAIIELADDPNIKSIYLDKMVPLPFPTALPAEEPMIAKGVPRPFGLLQGRPIIQSAINAIQAARTERGGFLRQKMSPVREPTLKPGWITTGETRRLLQADIARTEGVEGEDVLIAVLDTGAPALPFRRFHPQLSGPQVENVYLFAPLRQPDRSGHGSHVSSTIVGRLYEPGGGITIEGIAPGCHLLAIKVLETRMGVGRDSDILKGIEIAYQRGANIVNMSLGSEGYEPDNPFENVLSTLTSKGMIFSVAAGNSGPDPSTIGTPGGSPNVFTVASVNTSGIVAGFSSRGPVGPEPKPDLASYGGDNNTGEYIYTTTSLGSFGDKLDMRPGDQLSPMQGTSMATPHFSGLLGLWWRWTVKNRGRALTNADVFKIITSLGPHNDDIGYGVPKFDDIKGVI